MGEDKNGENDDDGRRQIKRGRTMTMGEDKNKPDKWGEVGSQGRKADHLGLN